MTRESSGRRWSRRVAQGAIAGVVGKAALDATTYGDMLVRGRASSGVPAETAGAAAEKLGLHRAFNPEKKKGRARREALGALLGAATGATAGVAYAIATGGRGIHPLAVAGPAIGVSAMAAANLPATVTGATNPARWSATDWLSDVVPHLVFGAVVAATFDALRR
jgi:hypothetical protein